MKKKWIVSAGVALSLGALVTMAVAEGEGRIREHGRPMAPMLEHLDLTGEQQEQLRELRKKHGEAMGEQRRAMAAMRREHLQALMEILTGEQKEAMREMRAGRGELPGRRGRWEEDEGGMRRGARGVFARLDLSEEQKEQIGERLDLSEEQKEQIGELRREHREEMRAARKKHRETLEKVLTDEQRVKLEEMKDEVFYGGGGRWRGKP